MSFINFLGDLSRGLESGFGTYMNIADKLKQDEEKKAAIQRSIAQQELENQRYGEEWGLKKDQFTETKSHNKKSLELEEKRLQDQKELEGRGLDIKEKQGEMGLRIDEMKVKGDMAIAQLRNDIRASTALAKAEREAGIAERKAADAEANRAGIEKTMYESISKKLNARKTEGLPASLVSAVRKVEDAKKAAGWNENDPKVVAARAALEEEKRVFVRSSKEYITREEKAREANSRLMETKRLVGEVGERFDLGLPVDGGKKTQAPPPPAGARPPAPPAAPPMGGGGVPAVAAPPQAHALPEGIPREIQEKWPSMSPAEKTRVIQAYALWKSQNGG